MENTSEFYYEKLKSADKPGVVLASFYCSLFDKDVTRSEIIMCNKLVRVFGRFTVYFSILSMAGTGKELDEPLPYLYAICQRKFENAHSGDTIRARESLSNYISDMQDEIRKVKEQKVKIPTSKGLEKDG